MVKMVEFFFKKRLDTHTFDVTLARSRVQIFVNKNNVRHGILQSSTLLCDTTVFLSHFLQNAVL